MEGGVNNLIFVSTRRDWEGAPKEALILPESYNTCA